ncbi:phosphonopyruvate decarboxylase [Methylophilus flavus]|jgi:phosphonopyruvate decarboxylase|uniref:Phosphonopyruvate decarboxylase n=1 Tax=Methylophilus flavus TaxID=640084 RepID=A0ABW3PBS0_9PROT
MIEAGAFLEALQHAGVQFFTGVPDSLLKELCACFSDRLPEHKHVIAANEGGATGLAMGHYLATGSPALVYMQNSGLGNVVNPIASLADPQIYGIPMLMVIGWRGEMQQDGTQIHDEPQHVKQGQITLEQLEMMGIPFEIFQTDLSCALTQTRRLLALAKRRSGPVALVVRKQSFAPYKAKTVIKSGHANEATLPSREDMLSNIVRLLAEDVAVVATTGMASRELFEFRHAQNSGHSRDFLTVGGMGHASQIACGIALAQPDRQVVCLDGDGAMLMHMGSLTLSAQQRNLVHIVFNNGAHDSVGGQPTVAAQLNLSSIAKAAGYQWVIRVSSGSQLNESLQYALSLGQSCFIEVLCRRGARADLGRPTRTPAQNKQDFMQFLEEVAYA